MTFDLPTPEPQRAVDRARSYDAEIRARIRAKEARVRTITRYARAKGLDANPDLVSRHMAWFERWYSGYLATGYLKNRTGIKDIPGRGAK